MSDYDLPIQFLKTLAVLASVSAVILFFWWKNQEKPSKAFIRRQHRNEVTVEQRKSERRKRPRLSGQWETLT